MADNKLPCVAAGKTVKNRKADVELLTPAYRAADRELQAADAIISMVTEAAQDGQFNLHVTKVRETSADGISEELVEKQLAALDTKRILEAARALEKAVMLKRRLLHADEKKSESAASKQTQMRVILPEVNPPSDMQSQGGSV